MAQNRIQITLESNAKCTEVCRHRTTYIHKVGEKHNKGIQNSLRGKEERTKRKW
jgi:hypothetical protein